MGSKEKSSGVEEEMEINDGAGAVGVVDDYSESDVSVLYKLMLEQEMKNINLNVIFEVRNVNDKTIEHELKRSFTPLT